VHTLVRRYLRTAIAFLFAGLAVGAWMLVRRELWDRYPTPHELSAHTHAIAVGFVMLMILGVALWLFPRPERDDTRYRPERIALAWWLVTLGTAARVLAELLRGTTGSPALRWAVVLSGFAQVAGLAVYFHTMWTRIRPLGSRQREAAGERF
jgi:heme/copper-type cytochrome/quinol oxidase subunit 1